jgi:DNA (cytosine-5)-methyltransferase 1
VGHSHREHVPGEPSAVPGAEGPGGRGSHAAERTGPAGGLEHADGERLEGLGLHLRERGPQQGMPETLRPSQGSEDWDTEEWVLCNDPANPRWRPIGPEVFPLAFRDPATVGCLRAYGNSIVAPLATEFVRACLD